LKRHGRDRWLDIYVFEAIDEVQQIATEWLWTCNKERPNMGIGGVTPAMKLKMAAQVLRSRSVKTGRITPWDARSWRKTKILSWSTATTTSRCQ
jgi:hypothetical protein